MENIFDINAPIVPATSIGGLKQGLSFKELENIVYKFKCKSLDLSLKVRSLNSVEYQYKDGVIGIVADIFFQRVNVIIVREGYLGKIDNTIHVGMTIRELFEIDNSFDCYATGGLMSLNYPGLVFYFTENFDADISDFIPYMNNKILGIGLWSQFGTDGKDVYQDIYGEEYYNNPIFVEGRKINQISLMM